MSLQNMFDESSSHQFRVGSKGHTGKKHDEQSRAKMSAARQKRVISDETRAKTSATLKGRIISDETRAKMSAALKGKTRSDEARAKMSAAAKLRWSAKND